MRAGKLRHLVQLRRLVEVQDPTSGAVNKTYEDFGPLQYGSLEYLSVREYIGADVKAANVVARVVIRHMNGVKASMRVVVDGGETFEVQGVLPDLNSGREYLTLPVSLVAYG